MIGCTVYQATDPAGNLLPGIGNQTATYFQNPVKITDLESFREAMRHDFVFSELNNGYRNERNFLRASCLVLDCDNDCQAHPEEYNDPDKWMSTSKLYEDIEKQFPRSPFYIAPSRNHTIKKNWPNGIVRPPRPKMHVLFPIAPCTDPKQLKALIAALIARFPWADPAVSSAAQLVFGTCPENLPLCLMHDGFMTVDIAVKLENPPPIQAQPSKAATGRGELPRTGIGSGKKANNARWWFDQNLESMLAAIPADERSTWIKVGAALKNENFPFELWDRWSQSASNYGGTAKAWDSFRETRATGAVIVKLAKENGWVEFGGKK